MPNLRRENFVYEYLRDLNATQAAARSGYRHPHVQGSRLLKHPEVMRQLDLERAQLKENSRRYAKTIFRMMLDDRAAKQKAETLNHTQTPNQKRRQESEEYG